MLDVDAGLFSTDFRASERTAQLIVQVAGRAGREDKAGTVILQTRHPDHPLLQRLVRRGYPDFASACLAERQAAALPPYSHQALWRAEATDSSAAMGFLNDLAALAHTLALGALLVLGPAPAPLARRGNRYRWQLLMQSDQRSILHSAIDQMLQSATGRATPRSIRWSVDVDPVDLF
jgi:primosomal protein N' (replication factor Y)